MHRLTKTILAALTAALMLCGCVSDTADSSSASVSEETGLVITLCEADKADAIILQTQEVTVLIDTGLDENAEELVETLQNMGVTEISAVILTHFDKDHIGGFEAITQNFTVDQVYTSYFQKDGAEVFTILQETGISYEMISETVTFTSGEVSFLIEGAAGGYTKNEDNNSSLVITVTYGDLTYLFMGDAQKERIAEYLAGHSDTVDFLKVPYHGNYMNALEELAAVLQAKDAVICCSSSDPDPADVEKTASLFEAFGANVWYTYEGTVTVTCTKTGYQIAQ